MNISLSLKILQRLLIVFQEFLKSLAHLARLFTIWLMPHFLGSSPTTPSHLACGPVIPNYLQDRHSLCFSLFAFTCCGGLCPTTFTSHSSGQLFLFIKTAQMLSPFGRPWPQIELDAPFCTPFVSCNCLLWSSSHIFYDH